MLFAIKLGGKLPQTSQLLCFLFFFFFVFLEQRLSIEENHNSFEKLVQSDALHSSKEFEEYFSERKIDADQSSIY